MLDDGDAKVWCTDGSVLLIERKTPSDFLGSIPNDHILDQTRRMMLERTATGILPFLVITGEIHRNPRNGGCIIPGSQHGDGWNWDSVQGMLLSIQEAGVPVIFCASETEYPLALLRLASRNKTQTLINPARFIDILTPQERVLCAFDGIGPELAAEILKRAGTLAWALSWLCDTTPTAPKIAGIATGRKLAIIKALQLEDGNTIDVISR
jgi:ERCC4-type nuclease